MTTIINNPGDNGNKADGTGTGVVVGILLVILIVILLLIFGLPYLRHRGAVIPSGSTANVNVTLPSGSTGSVSGGSTPSPAQ